MSNLKRFLIISISIFVLIAGVVAAYVFNVDSQKSVEEVTVNEVAEEESPASDNSVTESIDSVFANNSWETIAKVFKAEQAGKYWNLGDTKEVELTDGSVYEVQIVDMTPKRYALSSGAGYSNGVLQFVKCFNTTLQMNSSNTNIGGFGACELRTELNATIFNLLPDDLKVVISEVSIASGIGNGSVSPETVESNNKLFLPSECEIFGSKIYSVGASEGSPQFGYYFLHSTAFWRIKYIDTETSSVRTNWWLRSSCSGDAGAFCRISDGGNAFYNPANYSNGVCPCFAF